jgi:hypothetical protein
MRIQRSVLPRHRRPVVRPRPVDGPRPVVMCVAVLLLGACTAGTDTDRYTSVGDVQEVMAHIVEPSAQVYWGAVGWILDFEGEHEIRPANDDEWLAIENAAFMVAESGNLLMMDGRALDDGAWLQMSQALIEIGRRAVEVAEARDEQAVFDVGAEMYFVCSNCHATYALETLRPSDDRTGEAGGGG